MRYATVQEAQNAIKEFNGLAVKGNTLLVSMARYVKDGAPLRLSPRLVKTKAQNSERKWYPAHRDHRSFSEVLMGLQNRMQKLETVVEKKNSTIPAIFSLNVTENTEFTQTLKKAVIAENSEVSDHSQTVARIKACHVKVENIFSLSPTKLLIVFENENDAEYAVNMESPLWNLFDDVRTWSEGESFDDRLVWIECVGIHPLCWSKENVKLIGEKWGPVIHTENKVQGVDSITSARILLRTKAQNRIENRIKLFSNHCSCDVWVKELYGNCGESENKSSNITQTHAHVHDKQGEGLNITRNSTQTLPFSDPLMQDMIDNMKSKDDQDWVDPIVWNEITVWNFVENITSCADLGTPVSTPISTSRPSRPRGRPRKNSHQYIPPELPSHGMLETRKTWEFAQLLGITSQNEEAVLSGLRKSKRILLLEGKEA